jgi:hypothetical protein
MAGPRIVVVGGGSFQWVPKLLIDLVNTPSPSATPMISTTAPSARFVTLPSFGRFTGR